MTIETFRNDLPPEYPEELLPQIREAFLASERTVVVLDDDPTGTQTSQNVPVLLQWSVPLLTEELNKKPDVLFILTNSRSLDEGAAINLAAEIGKNLKEAVRVTGREIIPISRSDSTLRGHFPAEVDALVIALDMAETVWLLLPAFVEGARFTVDDIHYIVEQGRLTPVSETPFAADATFGYSHSDLKEWVEEKSGGRMKAANVVSFSIADIRVGGPQVVGEKLLSCRPGAVAVVNACSSRDIEVFVMGVLLAEKLGRKFIFRSSATLVPIRAGLPSGLPYAVEKTAVPLFGVLVVVGSYVPKTTRQLNYLLKTADVKSLEADVSILLQESATLDYLHSLVSEADRLLSEGKDVVLYTSRELLTGEDGGRSLEINRKVSEFLVRFVKGLNVRPAWIISKGGITSNDIASKGLGAEKATVLGSIIPGVPVWQLDGSSKFPALRYIVFPGNVGDDSALARVFSSIKVRQE